MYPNEWPTGRCTHGCHSRACSTAGQRLDLFLPRAVHHMLLQPPEGLHASGPAWLLASARRAGVQAAVCAALTDFGRGPSCQGPARWRPPQLTAGGAAAAQGDGWPALPGPQAPAPAGGFSPPAEGLPTPATAALQAPCRDRCRPQPSLVCVSGQFTTKQCQQRQLPGCNRGKRQPPGGLAPAIGGTCDIDQNSRCSGGRPAGGSTMKPDTSCSWGLGACCG
jgi:hypothetical protein